MIIFDSKQPKLQQPQLAHLPVQLFSHHHKQLLLIGYPILAGKLGFDAIAKACWQTNEINALVKKLSGTFLLFYYDPDRDLFEAFNDRFSYYSVYVWQNQNRFVCALSLSALAYVSERKINQAAAYEFLHFRRLFGDKTYWADVKSLTGAQHIRLLKGRLVQSAYWKPDYSQKIHSANIAADQLVSAVQQAASAYLSDGKQHGLLLSGGLDSRLVLAAVHAPITCYTLGYQENAEVAVSRQVAEAAGCKHEFLTLPKDHYSRIFQQACLQGEALNSFNHAHFFNIFNDQTPFSGVLLHGHGLDIFFQGLYLPRTRRRWFGMLTYLMDLVKVPEDAVAFYADQAKFRCKPVGPEVLVANEQISSCRDQLLSNITSEWQKASALTDDFFDRFDHLLIDALGKHYTHLNVLSIRQSCEEKTIAFDNSLLDLFCKMPANMRLKSGIMANAIMQLNPPVARVLNANTNFGIHYGQMRLSMALFVNTILKKMKCPAKLPPGSGQRSWLSVSELFQQNQSLYDKVSALPDSPGIQSLSFLDMDKLQHVIHETRMGNQRYLDLLCGLLTLNQYFSEALL